jgi:hypothetical protein
MTQNDNNDGYTIEFEDHPQNTALDFAQAVKRDTEGGHQRFPMLHWSSPLYRKLADFVDEVDPPQWFDEQGFFVGELPKDCIHDCTHSGDCTDDLKRWVIVLGFRVPRERSIAYLKEYGAWDVEELESMDDEELSMKVLWLACGDIVDNGEYIGLVH